MQPSLLLMLIRRLEISAAPVPGLQACFFFKTRYRDYFAHYFANYESVQFSDGFDPPKALYASFHGTQQLSNALFPLPHIFKCTLDCFAVICVYMSIFALIILFHRK